MPIRVLRTGTEILRTSSGICCYDFPASVNVAANGSPDWWVYLSGGAWGAHTHATNYVNDPILGYEYPYTKVYASGAYTYTQIYHQSTMTLALVSGILTWTLYVKVHSTGRYGSYYYYPSHVGTVEWWGTKTGIDPRGTYNQSSVVTTGPVIGEYPSSATVS